MLPNDKIVNQIHPRYLKPYLSTFEVENVSGSPLNYNKKQSKYDLPLDDSLKILILSSLIYVNINKKKTNKN